MKKKMAFLAVLSMGLLFSSFTTLTHNEDPNVSKIRENVQQSRQYLKQDIKAMPAEQLVEFKQQFQNGFATLSNDDKIAFLKKYLSHFNQLSENFEKISVALRSFAATNSEFKAMTATQKETYLKNVVQYRNQQCAMGYAFGLAGCGNWANGLIAAGYPQSYVDSQFQACWIMVEVAYILCEEDSAAPED